MSKELLILRHAKSDWDSAAKSDFDRPLSARGRKDAPRIGDWLKQQDLVPDYILSSPAKRAKQTVQLVTKSLGLKESAIHFAAPIYLASRTELLHQLREVPANTKRAMLVGHNPGLDSLLEYLCGTELDYTESGKLLTTAALARVALPDDWHKLPQHAGTLLQLIRPRDLKNRA